MPILRRKWYMQSFILCFITNYVNFAGSYKQFFRYWNFAERPLLWFRHISSENITSIFNSLARREMLYSETITPRDFYFFHLKWPLDNEKHTLAFPPVRQSHCWCDSDKRKWDIHAKPGIIRTHWTGKRTPVFMLYWNFWIKCISNINGFLISRLLCIK